MKNIYKPAICALLAIVLLSGCASLWNREIYERYPHLAQEVSSAALTANSHDTLKNAIIGVIRSGEKEVSIRVTDYPGELTSLALSGLLSEIQKQEPIGAYAVDYMAFVLAPVLSQYTITLNIVYKHEARPDIMPVSGRWGLETAVHTALTEYDSTLTVEMQVYYAQDHDAGSMVRSFYYNNPAWAMEYPGITTGLYPSSGGFLPRIIELTLDWQSAPGDLRQKARATEAGAALLLEGMPEFSGDAEERSVQTVLWLHDTLCSAVSYDRNTAMLAAGAEERPGGDPYTAYGALVNRLAVSEGHAMAFKLLCDILGFDSIVVTGFWRGDEHAWNLVRIGEIWYHIGIAFDNVDPLPIYDYFLLDDESAAMEHLVWDKSLYPAALPGPWPAAEALLF